MEQSPNFVDMRAYVGIGVCWLVIDVVLDWLQLVLELMVLDMVLEFVLDVGGAGGISAKQRFDLRKVDFLFW